ncbi:hypothetical protein AB1Y20_017716 [Prymnesium parvum]|uniref:EF-hand domain-containing protein n=1 Tax=Prymnesium parvum TaxID=97485 RepID=A0AB34JPW8_PRYPA
MPGRRLALAVCLLTAPPSAAISGHPTRGSGAASRVARLAPPLPRPSVRVRRRLPSPQLPRLSAPRMTASPLSRAAGAPPAGAPPPLAPPRIVTRAFTLRVLGATVALLAGGALSFRRWEGWPMVDCLYYTTSTFATIGFGDLKPTRSASRVLTSLLSILGVGLLGGLISATLEEWMRSSQNADGKAPSASKPLLDDSAADSAAAEDALLAWWPLYARGVALRRTVHQRLARLAPRAIALLSNPWVQVSLLYAVGVCGYRACTPAVSVAEAAYLILGALTTSGLGDVVPTGRSAKLFLSLYSPFAALMFARVLAFIALVPLEEARRRKQLAVLKRYAHLSKKTLDEVSRGPLVKRLGISEDDNFCTRAEFTLLMLVLQGKVMESDLQECVATFDSIDADCSGKLTIEDVELLHQRRLLRNPRLQRRVMMRAWKSLFRQRWFPFFRS